MLFSLFLTARWRIGHASRTAGREGTARCLTHSSIECIVKHKVRHVHAVVGGCSMLHVIYSLHYTIVHIACSRLSRVRQNCALHLSCVDVP